MRNFTESVFKALQEAANAGFDGILLDAKTGQIISQSPVHLAPRINMELLRSEIMQLIQAYEEDQLQ